MDRIIEVKVCGSHLTKDSNKAGTKGEANMTRLRITFDENWEDFAKRVIFWDAYGQNPVKVVLGTNLIEDIQKSTRVYLVSIPAEAMARAGWLTFSIQGTLDNKNQVSITSKLEVNDSPDILEPLEPTPSELEQMQAEIETIKDGLKDLETVREEAAEAEKLLTRANEIAAKAEAAVGKASYIGDNGNWYAWDSDKGEFYDTGVRAQGGSMVSIAAIPPENADVWIKDGTTLYIRNENGVFVQVPTIIGEAGKSAYQQAVEAGYNGSLEQFTTLLNNLTYTIEADHLSDTNNPHKVTAAQAGALPITGGTLTGPTLGLGNGNGQVIAGETYAAILAAGAGGNAIRMLRVINPDYASYPLSKSAQLNIVEGNKETEYNLYGEHNKPTASDVGAVPVTGGTMTGPLIIDKNEAWSQVVIRTPSGYYRSFEADDSRVRIDVRDEQDTNKRRYIDIFTNTADSRHSHALRFGQTIDGETTASYVLHTENIKDFVISGGSYTGDGKNEGKTIPIRKTTRAVIIVNKDSSVVGNTVQCFFTLCVRGTNYCYYLPTGSLYSCEWGEEFLRTPGTMMNFSTKEYNYVLIG